MSTNSKSDNPNADDWISQAEAARVRGTSRQAINRLIQRGRLRTLSIGTARFVSREDVMAFVPAPVGRKPGK